MSPRTSATANLPDADIAIVGGGLVALSIAAGLTAGGARGIAILDEGDVAFRASRGNFALVWVQGKGASLPDYARLSLRSADLWADFAAEIEDETGIALHHERRGGVTACLGEAELEAHASRLRRLHNAGPGIADFEALDHAALKRLLPAIGPRVAGGIYCPADGHVNSLRLFRALHALASKRGAAYEPNAGVEAIEPGGSGFLLRTARGTMRARRVVLAAGLGNARLAPFVGLHAPVRPERGQVLVTEKLAPFLPLPLGTARQTDEGGVMLGDSKEDAGLDVAGTVRVQALIARRAVATFPLLARARIVRAWSALRVMSPDGHPIYDRSRSHPGAYLVTCHSGVTLAAAHARLVAPLIASGLWGAASFTDPVAFDPAPFGASRFRDVPQAA